MKWTKKHGRNGKNAEDGKSETEKDQVEVIWGYLESQKLDNLDFPYYPGTIDIPVCGAREALHTWLHHYGDKTPRYYSYPCDPEE